MIRRLTIENFKSIENQNIRLSNLNIFAGANGAGKSSAIQTLLLAKQISKKNDAFSINLNGEFTELGDTRSIFHKWAKKEETKVTFKLSTTESFSYSCKPSERDTIALTSNPYILANNIRYLGANRITPADIFQYSTDKNERRDLGLNGEFSTAFLSQNIREPLAIQELRHKNDSEGISGSYGANANAWLQEISPGIRVNASKLLDLNASRLQYEYYGAIALSEISPFNVGFGITYALPVVMLVLSSQPGDILIIENPEAHVHPRGQIAMGKLLAQAAHAGLQIFIETHSDHLFNGVRLYIKESRPKFTKYAIHYATRTSNKEDGFKTVFTEVKLTDTARIKSAPVGFFDDWESAIYELL